MKKIIFPLLVLFSLTSYRQGFLRQNGKNIVDGQGSNIVLRGLGLGLGGWMVQEGFQ